MSSLGWGRLYGIGIEQIDADHSIISNLVIQLDDAFETDQSREIVTNLISVIAEFTRHHVRRELEVWRTLESTPSPSHLNDHNHLVAELELIVARWSAGEWSMTEDMRRIKPFLDTHSHRHNPLGRRSDINAVDQTPNGPFIGSSAHGA